MPKEQPYTADVMKKINVKSYYPKLDVAVEVPLQ